MQYKEDSQRKKISEEAFGRPLQSENYAQFRPSYPEFFFTEEVLKVVNDLKATLKDSEPLLALDLGCGPGQSTFQIAKYFEKVIGVDINTKQLSVANAKKTGSNETDRISFINGDCSKIEAICSEDLKGQKIHAIFICEAFHWFNQSDILEQCKRILQPTGGSLFLLGYSTRFHVLPSSAEFGPFFEVFQEDINDLYDFNLKVLNNFYKDINFKEYFKYEKFLLFHQDQLNYPMDRFIGYLDTLSAYRNKLERVDKSPEKDSLRVLCRKLGFGNYHRGKLGELDCSTGPKTLDFKTPFFMYSLKN